LNRPPLFSFIHYYITTADGKRKKNFVKLCDKSARYRVWADVEALIIRELEKANGQHDGPSASITITEFVEKHYQPWIKRTALPPQRTDITNYGSSTGSQVSAKRS
jgi:hypothetical protein